MAGPAYQFGRWRFEPTECRLLRDGEVVPLPAKTLDVLATLLRRAPRLVTKEEILAAVWADAVVEEGNIAFHVAALRKVLDENDASSAIETVRGRGYRFVEEVAIHQMPPTDHLTQEALARAVAATASAPVTPPAIPEAPAPPVALPPPVLSARGGRRVALLIAVIVAAVLGVYAWWQSRPEPWTIAVEPFEIVNPAAGEENFPLGLRPYLTQKMELSGIKLAPPDTATAVLSGQLHPFDGGFHVTVQLTRTGDGMRVWDWSFDVPRDTDKPPAGAGPDDERSRLQGAIAGRASEGLRSYLNLSPAASVTR